MSLVETTSIGYVDMTVTGKMTVSGTNSNKISVGSTNGEAFDVNTVDNEVVVSNLIAAPELSNFPGSQLQLPNPPASSIDTILCSATGHYVSTGAGLRSGSYNSANYARTYSALNSYLYTTAAMSQDGKYQIAVSTAIGLAVSISSDYGATWTQTTIKVPKSRYSAYTILTAAAMSQDGKYQVICGQQAATAGQYMGILTSSNYGVTWSEVSASVFLGLPQPASGMASFSYFAAIDLTGRYQVCSDPYGAVFQSSDYGKTWFKCLNPDIQFPAAIFVTTGVLAIASAPDRGGLATLYLSRDFGTTFVATTMTAFNPTISMSNNAQYMFFLDQFASSFSYSSDGGQSWTTSAPIVDSWGTGRISPLGNFIILTKYNGGPTDEIWSYNAGLSVNNDVIPQFAANFNIGTPTQTFSNGYFANAVYAAGIALTSSRALKTDIEDMPDMTDFVLRLRPRTYRFRREIESVRHHGLILDEVETAADEFPNSFVDGSHLHVTELVSVLINVIQKLEARVRELEK